MTNLTLPKAIESVFEKFHEPKPLFVALMPVLGEILKCDRVFLYARNPDTKVGIVPVCWRRSSDIPEVLDSDWKEEPASLTSEDPMFAAAVQTKPSIYVEDVETASPDIVNREFEHSTFGHRALIHSHLCYENQLWGILQPCIFGTSRPWSDFDRIVMSEVETKLTPVVVKYIRDVKTT
ncbi:MAG: GAF domain-containing protein [Calothrix sp. C42_A2020_038]|nr:GAF domain-containing protein [Calothrix sp. C42_A2020_038]